MKSYHLEVYLKNFQTLLDFFLLLKFGGLPSKEFSYVTDPAIEREGQVLLCEGGDQLGMTNFLEASLSF